MSDEFLLPIEVFYFAPFLIGPVTGGICGKAMSNLRVWHGLLLGVFLGPVTVIPTFAIALVSWASTGSDAMSTGAQVIHFLVILCVIPATWGLCFLVGRLREEADGGGGKDLRSP